MPLRGQNESFCGDMPPHTATSTNPDSIVYDRFGNSYDLNYFQTNTSEFSQGGCNSGYFNLTFSNDILPEWQTIICQVFSDVSSLIERRDPHDGCIELEPINITIQGESTGDALATATPFYDFNQFYHLQCGYMMNSSVYERINNGVSTLPVADGLIFINTSSNFYSGTGSSVGTGLYDLYSVILHEAMHILGYASVSAAITNFGFPILSLWDANLYAVNQYNPNGTNNTIGKVFVGDCIENCWELNPALFESITDYENIVNTNCVSGNTEIELGFGSPLVAPISGPNIDCNTSFINMLSHLNPYCHGQNINYVMSPCLDSGEDRRELTPPELQILCDLGYEMESCNNCYVATQIDDYHTNQIDCCYREYFLCNEETIEIPISELLCNDSPNSDIIISNVFIQPEFENVVDIQLNSETIEITLLQLPTLDPGDQYFIPINYTVKGCNCQMSDSYFVLNIGPCNDCTGIDPCDNQICIQGFEQYEEGIYFDINGYAFHYSTINVQNYAIINENLSGNHYATIVKYGGATNSAFVLPLQQPLEPGCSIKIEFDAFVNNFPSPPITLAVYPSADPPCNYLDAIIPNDLCDISIDCGTSYQYNPICASEFLFSIDYVGDFNSIDFDGEHYSSTWFNSSTQTINYLLFKGLDNPSFISIDNIVVTKECLDASFSIDDNCPEISFFSVDSPGEEMNSWDFGDNTSPSIESNPTHIYTSSGTFIITHTVTDDCGNTESSTQSVVIDIPVAAFTFTLTTCPSYQFTNTSDGSNLQFAWDFGNGNTSTDENPIFAFADNGSYTVTLTVSNGCGSSTIMQEVVVNCPTINFSCNCPVGSTSYYIGTDSDEDILISDSDLPEDFTSQSCVNIIGNLIINVPTYSFLECEIIMQPGARIIVRPDNRLVVKHGQIHGCPDAPMWRTILMKEGSILDMAQTEIVADAQHAITINEDVTLILASNHFARNYISLYNQPIDPSAAFGFTLGSFNGNEFHCENMFLHPAYDANIVFPANSKSYAAIHLNNITGLTDFGVNIQSVPENTFHDMNNGIILKNINAGIYNAFFSDILQYQTSVQGLPTGDAISGESTSTNDMKFLTVQGFSDIPCSTDLNFSNCFRGIIIDKMNLTAQNNYMENMVYGIWAARGMLPNIDIGNNCIEATNKGIYLYYPTNPVNNFTIHHNSISIPSTTGIGIEFNQNALIPPAGSVDISFNVVYAPKGIFSNYTSHSNITNNIITITNSSNLSEGIDLTLCDKASLLCNQITGPSSNMQSNATIGLRVNNTTNSTLQCTILNNTYSGIKIEGACNGTSLIANSFDTHRWGLWYTNFAVTGDQSSSILDLEKNGNTWTVNTNMPGRAGAYHLGDDPIIIQSLFGTTSNLSTLFTPQRIRIRNTTFIAGDPIDPLYDLDQIWFRTGEGGNIECDECNFFELLSNFENDNTETSLDRAIANEELVFSDYQEELKWIQDGYLYKKLSEELTLLENSAMEDFYENVENASTALYKNIELDIKEAVTLDPVNKQLLEGLLANIKTRMEVLKLLDEAIQQSETPVQGLLALRESESEALLQEEQSYKAALAGYENLYSGQSGLINQDNILLPANKIYEINWKLVNSINTQLATEREPDLNEEQIQSLSDIASQCPLTGGNAVFVARSLLSTVHPTAVYVDYDICLSEGVVWHSEEQEEEMEDKTRAFFLHPNPADGTLNISWDVSANKVISVSIFDAFGNMFRDLTTSLNPSGIQLDISDLPSGAYLICINTGDHMVFKDKFIVIH
jgi:PKD repeat protein